ncbi:hypothetical protein [Actibacterium ureilyticum]|uniref:hypothetical protein n=1 Tax=Actibacterium ureilyticum TaxID=1590614 RepID=UPI000BAB1C6D|nr:hypothetical protein [Actibacterium ureilyticum]
MSLKYDFDMFALGGEGGKDSATTQGVLNDVGVAHTNAGNKIALFRNRETAEALAGASEKVRQYFLDSGFGLTTFASGAPDGFYPETDEDARLYVINALTVNLGSHDLSGEDFGAFDMNDFLEHIDTAEPMTWEPPQGVAALAAWGLTRLTAPLRRLMPIAALGLVVFAVYQI